MSADDEIRRSMAQGTAMTEEIFAQVVLEVERSIKFGSELTGAPGQPVQTGNLRNSWEHEFETKTHAFVTTPVEYAQAIENGVGPHGPLTLRSTVGGFHSVDHTTANLQRIADVVTERVLGKGRDAP